MRTTAAAWTLLGVLFLASAAPCRADDADLGLPELEPLVITAPHVKIQQQDLPDPIINATLLRLLQQRADARPTPQDQLDASVGSLVNLTTPTGYKLKTRYTELGFLLTEGLAGVKDQQLTNELERVVRLGTNAQTRAAAMVALAYTKDTRYLSLFQGALVDPSVTVRFGAIEALIILGDQSTRFMISNAASSDLSPTLRIYAAGSMWKEGDINGREILLRYYQDNDWFLRALSTHYLGEYGGADEYIKLFQRLSLETDPTVKTELCAALLRLGRFR